MARARTIKPGLLEDIKTAHLPDDVWRLFVSLLLVSDDFGNLHANPERLRGVIFWGQPDGRDVWSGLTMLMQLGLVRLYRVREQTYAHIVGWGKHQKVDHPSAAQIPGPNDLESKDVTPQQAATSREPRETFALDRIGEERIGGDLSSVNRGGPGVPGVSSIVAVKPANRPGRLKRRHEYSAAYERVWALYGRHEEKVQGFGEWLTRAEKEGGEEALEALVIAALEWQAPSWAQDGWKYAPYIGRYLKRQKYRDEQKAPQMTLAPKTQQTANAVRAFIARHQSKGGPT